MQETRQGPVTLVLGGVRSGKSRYAQQLAMRWQHVVFVATAIASDDEMHRKITRHREERPEGWLTVEEPIDLPQVLTQHDLQCDGIVIDCLTLFAANVLDRHGDDESAIEQQIEAFCAGLRSVRCPVVIVSNEVGSGVVPASVSGRRYRDLLGEINQRVARIADDVILMVAGLPLAVKGHLEVTA